VRGDDEARTVSGARLGVTERGVDDALRLGAAARTLGGVALRLGAATRALGAALRLGAAVTRAEELPPGLRTLAVRPRSAPKVIAGINPISEAAIQVCLISTLLRGVQPPRLDTYQTHFNPRGLGEDIRKRAGIAYAHNPWKAEGLYHAQGETR
jgi:hypothetical protein